MAGLHDYIVERDHFEYTNTLGFCFPCCVCAHRNIRQSRPPCNRCDHNANAIPIDEDEGGE